MNIVENQKCDNDVNIFKLMRIARGVTARQLAEELDVSPSYIHAIEKGERQPSEKLYNDYLLALKFDENIIETFNKQSRKYNSYERLLYCLLKLICK